MVPRYENVIAKLQESIAAIFDQAQITLANHRKNCVALYKLHQQTATVTQPSKKENMIRLVGERAFGDAFIDMVNRVLVVKKGPVTADRVVRFVGSYVKFMNEKVSTEKAKVSGDSCSASLNGEDDDTIASRFLSRLLKWLFQGFCAKNKNTRYRSVSIVSEMIAHLGELDEDTYGILRDGLIERLCDKESLIRTHAVIALSKLVGSEDPSDTQPGERTILEVLLDVLCYDPAAEVRRAALLQVPLTPSTLSAVLSRTRDTDALTRKLVYSAVLQPKLAHPRQLTIAQREQVVKDGLGDREPSVRVATGKMIGSWFDVVVTEASDTDEGTWIGDDGGVMKGFVKFLSLFDVIIPGQAIAVDAMLSIFVTRPDISDVFVFPDAFWKELTPETAVLARVFVEHCLETKNEARLEAASMPVVTAFAFHIQESYNVLLDILQDAEHARLLAAGEGEEEEEVEQREENLAKRETILAELLRMTLKLDYMDEIGRRKVFTVVRDMLAHPELPPGLIEPALDTLSEIMPTERELIRVVVEIIIELREDHNGDNHDLQSTANQSQSDITQTTISNDKSVRKARPREEMTADERLEADIVDIRCLTLFIGMLERVHGSFEDNSTLEGILADLVIPSVRRKELVMREKGLVSLGLCCLIAKNMALSSFQLFVSQVQSAPEELKVRVLQVIFDLLFLYNQEFLGRSEDITNRIVEFLLQTLDSEDSARTQAVLCVGFCKLLISGKITDPRVLSSLLLIYVSPTTTTNYELRQCLSYFFPVYCYSSPVNQSRMQSTFIDVFDHCVRMHEDLEDDQEMISPYQVGLLVADWTNPQKIVAAVNTVTPDQDVHAELAIDILAALYDPGRATEDQKILCQLLSHLHIMPGLDHRSILKLNILLSHHDDQCPFNDASVDKIFNKFHSRFTKIFAKDLHRIDIGQYQDDEFHKLYDFIGVDIPEHSNDSRVPSPVRTSRSPTPSVGRERLPTPSTDQCTSSSPTPSPRKHKKQRPKAVKNESSKLTYESSAQEEAHSVEDELSDAIPPAALVNTPKRKGIKRVHTPGSGTRTSPLVKKRSRMKGPRTYVHDNIEYPRSKVHSQLSDTVSQGHSTPTKSGRQMANQQGNATDEVKELAETVSESDL